MASADMLKLADDTIRAHLREQCQRLVAGGYPGAAITGNYGTDAEDGIWCNIRLEGLGGVPVYGFPENTSCHMADLEKAVTEALRVVPLKTRQRRMAERLFCVLYSTSEPETLDRIERALSPSAA